MVIRLIVSPWIAAMPFTRLQGLLIPCQFLTSTMFATTIIGIAVRPPATNVAVLGE
jgi:hypothetical protein